MKRKQVDSSMLASVGYEPKSETLELEFNSSAIWQYYGFSKTDYKELIKSESLGRYFLHYIKGQYTENRIR
jgi:hypothetical protein